MGIFTSLELAAANFGARADRKMHKIFSILWNLLYKVPKKLILFSAIYRNKITMLI
jgi:hypothetical protein